MQQASMDGSTCQARVHTTVLTIRSNTDYNDLNLYYVHVFFPDWLLHFAHLSSDQVQVGGRHGWIKS